MHLYPDEILPQAGSGLEAEDPPDAEPGAVVRLVRDGPVPKASCPHCGGRLQLSTVGARWQIHKPSDVADRLILQLGTLEREELHVLILNTRNVVVDQQRVYQGNVSASIVRIGELFRRAVEIHGSAIILVHNHPSGDTTPSPDDLRLTAEALAAGRLLDIAVLDHIVVGEGTYTSLRDRGVAFDLRESGISARERRGPWWRDARYGAYKSATQKYIRRGEVDKAVAAGAALAGLPGGRAMLGRRLSVIAAEDVGWRFIPAAARAAKECEALPDDEALPRLLAVAAGLAALPKSKEAFWLAATSWGGRRVPTEVSASALCRAIAAGDHQEAMAICLNAKENMVWRSSGRVIDALRGALLTSPPQAQEIGRWALWREAQGGYGTGELIASALIAAIDRPDGQEPVLPVVDASPSDGEIHLDFYTLDGHTDRGRRSLARVARTQGVDERLLAGLMFAFESIRLGPSELPCRWRDEARQLDAVAGGWGTPAAGAKLWASFRPAVQADIERELEGNR